MCVHCFKPRWPRQKATVWIFQLCLWTIASTLCVTMSNAIVCPLEFIVSVYSQLLLLAWESMVMWSSTRCGKDHPSFCSHCRIKQKTKENRISSTLEETPWQGWVHGSGKLAMSAQTNCNNHHWQPTCALTTSALKNYIMWWRETVMLVVAMIDSFLCSLRRDVLLENSSCLFPKTFHCSKSTYYILLTTYLYVEWWWTGVLQPTGSSSKSTCGYWKEICLQIMLFWNYSWL